MRIFMGVLTISKLSGFVWKRWDKSVDFTWFHFLRKSGCNQWISWCSIGYIGVSENGMYHQMDPNGIFSKNMMIHCAPLDTSVFLKMGCTTKWIQMAIFFCKKIWWSIGLWQTNIWWFMQPFKWKVEHHRRHDPTVPRPCRLCFFKKNYMWLYGNLRYPKKTIIYRYIT